ncbi:sulfur carrier protein ThiS [Paenimyroides baculatum]|uniref:Sulfur carrier protein ThiS n=1 Tax=Paenimyroides baculatum TaxID=2608000 RepID=A0A5M6CE04_9FLAO|nr:sulfur carrier protein ThiS [Paenimyroides baculatum]KAA5532082.1 sulfur carrier protein ThiS [Paenimyroides baculatum]
MELTINHQKKFFKKPPSSLEQLLLSENLKKEKGIAVALNNQVVPQKHWGSAQLKSNDTILIITATQGG